jgi:glycine/D-amino acid oxidase-like deaminating enzyme
MPALKIRSAHRAPRWWPTAIAGAIARVEEIIRSERIDCEFERLDGYLYALPGNGFQDLDKEFAAATRAGVQVERLARVPGLPFDTGPCVRYPGQAQFHPLKYLDGLARAVLSHGGVIHGATQALKIDRDRDTNGPHQSRDHPRRLGSSRHQHAVQQPGGHAHQAGGLPIVRGRHRGARPAACRASCLWDTGDPYYYLRLETAGAPAGHEVLVVGGADHKVGQDTHPEHRYAEIERWVRERYPMAGAVLYRWSGEVMEPADGLAFLGINPLDEKNVYLITGDSGNGMTHCTIGAMLVTDLILGRENPWTALYDPARKMVHGLSDFVGEQVNTMASTATGPRAAKWNRCGKSRRAKARSSIRDCTSWRCIATSRARCTRCRRSARTWAAWCTSIQRSGRGIVHATARASTPRAPSCTARQRRRWRTRWSG